MIYGYLKGVEVKVVVIFYYIYININLRIYIYIVFVVNWMKKIVIFNIFLGSNFF